MKSGGGKSQRREEKKKEDQRKNQKKDDADARKGRKAGYDCVFPPEGRKVGSLKRRVRRHLARWGVKNCTPLWREHISKSKCTKHVSFGEFLGLEMSKKCTPLWREAHFEVNMYKTRRNTFGSWDVQKCTPLWREAHFDAKSVKNWRSLGPLLGAQMPFRMAGARDCAPSPCQKWATCDGFVAVSTAATVHYTPPHPTTQQQLQPQPQPHYITLTTLHYTPVRCTTLHSISFNYTALH